jgi:hypothetical protein
MFCSNFSCTTLDQYWVAVPHHFNAIRIQLFTVMRIRNQMMRIYSYLSKDPPGPHCERPRLYFEPQKIFNFDFNEDPDPAPALKNNADPDSHQQP